jgi:hypothetical protein
MNIIRKWWWIGAIAVGIYLYCNPKYLSSIKGKLGLVGGPTGNAVTPGPGS